MERGPMALFGAIVAVGLGPAVWLGAEFGRFDVDNSHPPAAVSDQHPGADKLLGGTGAGDDSTSNVDTTVLDTTPRAHVRPLTIRPSASPSASRTSAGPSASASPSTSVSSNPDKSSSPSASPSASTSPVDTPGDGGSGETTVPPVPPPTPSDGSGSGDGGSGGSGNGINPTDPATGGAPGTTQTIDG